MQGLQAAIQLRRIAIDRNHHSYQLRIPLLLLQSKPADLQQQQADGQCIAELGRTLDRRRAKLRFSPVMLSLAGGSWLCSRLSASRLVYMVLAGHHGSATG